MVSSSNGPLLITGNTVRESMLPLDAALNIPASVNGPVPTPGGKVAVYLTNTLIRMDDNTKLKESEAFGVDGNFVDMQLVKSRSNGAGATCTLVFDKATGFDEELSLFLMLKQAGRINGGGVSFYIGDNKDYRFSQKTFKEKLHSIPELQKIFIDEVIDVLSGEMKERDEKASKEWGVDINYDILNKINNSVA